MATPVPETFGPWVNLAGQVALVTGAGGGIGSAISRTLAQAGATVVVTDRDLPGAERVAESLKAAGLSGSALKLDVTSEAEVASAFESVDREHGSVDILVNNAGASIRKSITELSLAEWREVFDVNVTSLFLCSREAARRMVPRRTGVIVNIASIMGLSGGGLYPNPSYQASKGAVVNFTRALAVELGPHEIRVNAVAPTWVKTEFIGELLQNRAAMERIEASMPLRRIAEPKEVAGAVLFLCSPMSSMTTGHILPVDGGFLAQ